MFPQPQIDGTQGMRTMGAVLMQWHIVRRSPNSTTSTVGFEEVVNSAANESIHCWSGGRDLRGIAIHASQREKMGFTKSVSCFYVWSLDYRTSFEIPASLLSQACGHLRHHSCLWILGDLLHDMWWMRIIIAVNKLEAYTYGALLCWWGHCV